MTEVEWLTTSNPYAMLATVWGRASVRKVRLFAVARCRLMWATLRDDRCRRAVSVAEAFADGLAGDDELIAADELVAQVQRESDFRSDSDSQYRVAMCRCCCDRLPRQVAGVWHAFLAPPQLGDDDVVRDIFINPFRPVAFDPLWLASTVVALAGGIYADRAFDRLPILADALEEAGCDHADILSHCRGPGPHVRGCWVVDSVLGKS